MSREVLETVKPHKGFILEILLYNNQRGLFYMNLNNGGYFIEWPCGTDLSSDTIEGQTS